MHTTLTEDVTFVRTSAPAPRTDNVHELLAAAFPLLRDMTHALDVQKGPGVIPLPWTGPNGELVLVHLDADGRMLTAPVLCATPKAAMHERQRHAALISETLGAAPR